MDKRKHRISYLHGRAFVHHPDGCVAVLQAVRPSGRIWRPVFGTQFLKVWKKRRRGPLAHSRPEAVRRFQRSGYIAYA